MRFIIVLLFMVVACSRGESATSEGTKPDPKPATGLLEKGAPPYATLEASFKPGLKQPLRVKSEWRIAAGYGSLVSANFEMAAFTYDVQTEVKGVAGGMAHFEFVIAEVTATSSDKVSQRYVDLGKKSAALLKGAQGSFTINQRGLVEAVDIMPPAEVTTILHDMIEQVARGIRLASLPLPEGPVGKGAKWTITQPLQQRGANTEQTSTVELVGIDDSLLQAKVVYQTTAPDQTFELPGNPARAQYKLQQLGFEGQAEGTWEPGRFAPKNATETTDIIFKMRSLEEKPNTVIMSRTTTLTVEAPSPSSGTKE